MQPIDADAFELPPSAIREAIQMLRNGTHETVSFRQYVRSAQVLLVGLVEAGWPITPPSSLAS